MRKIIHPDADAESIQFNDSRSMSVMSNIPVFVASMLIGVLVFEQAGFAASLITFAITIACLLYLRGRILVAIRRRQDDSFEFQSLRKIYSFQCNEVEAVTVHGIAPAFSLMLLVKVSGRFAPEIFFAGALSTSAGGYKETIKAINKMC